MKVNKEIKLKYFEALKKQPSFQIKGNEFYRFLKRTIDILASIFAILYYHVYLYWLSLHHEDQLYINQFDTLIKANILICISLD